jgi:ABC-type dipeptide/oligopeptide/nickel transport system ATPase component
MTPPGPAPGSHGALLEVDRLTVTVPGPAGPVAAVREVSFTVGPGETVGLVGESGAGKSLTAHAVLRLLPPGVRIAGGRVLLEGRDLVALPEAAVRRVRGGRVGMVFQEPMTALNPAFTIGFQLVEAIRAHRRLDRGRAREEARRLLDRVAIPQPERHLASYPHELSGGQRQRVVIAMALACRPALLLADEPTSALDVTVQARILELLRELREELGLAILLITHDLAVVAQTCDRALVMAAGRIVEEAAVAELFRRPRHPYTRALLAAAEAVA